MNRSLLALVGITTLTLIVSRGRGQDPAADDPKALAKLGAPGPEHKLLQSLVGAWTLSNDGSKATGRAEFKSIWDGRFVVEETSLPFGDFTWEWRGTYGYDKHKNKYTAVWVDNMDTNTESAEGSFDGRGKTLTLKGQHDDPRTGKLEAFLWRVTVIDDTQLKIQMLEVDKLGNEKVALEILGKKSK